MWPYEWNAIHMQAHAQTHQGIACFKNPWPTFKIQHHSPSQLYVKGFLLPTVWARSNTRGPNIPRIRYTVGLLNKLQWEPLSDRRLNRSLAIIFRAMHFGEIGVDIESHCATCETIMGAKQTANRGNSKGDCKKAQPTVCCNAQQYQYSHEYLLQDASKKWNQLGCESSRLLCRSRLICTMMILPMMLCCTGPDNNGLWTCHIVEVLRCDTLFEVVDGRRSKVRGR